MPPPPMPPPPFNPFADLVQFFNMDELERSGASTSPSYPPWHPPSYWGWGHPAQHSNWVHGHPGHRATPGHGYGHAQPGHHHYHQQPQPPHHSPSAAQNPPSEGQPRAEPHDEHNDAETVTETSPPDTPRSGETDAIGIEEKASSRTATVEDDAPDPDEVAPEEGATEEQGPNIHDRGGHEWRRGPMRGRHGYRSGSDTGRPTWSRPCQRGPQPGGNHSAPGQGPQHAHGHGHPWRGRGGPAFGRRAHWADPFNRPNAKDDLAAKIRSLSALDPIFQHITAQVNEHLFGTKDAGNSGETTQPDAAESFTPPVDLFTSNSGFVLHVSLPGVKREDVGLDWDPEQSELRIAGVVHRPGDEAFLRTLASAERPVGVFERKVKLPPAGVAAGDKDEIDADGITAKLEDGVLIVVVPTVEREWTAVRKIDIE